MGRLLLGHPGRRGVHGECDAPETCYIIAGEVVVKTDEERVPIKPGDLVTFPRGLKCVWEVTAPIGQHFKFD